MKNITYLFILLFISITAFAQTEITDDLNFTGTGHEIKKALIETVASLGAETPTAGRFVRVSNGSVYVGNGSSWERAVFVLGSPTLGTVTAGTAQAQILKATGDGVGNGVFIGTDTQLYRSAANVITTPDSITSATQTVIGGDLLLGSTGSLQRFMVLDPYGTRGINVAHLRFNTASGNTIKLNTPLDSGAYYMTSFEVNTLNSANQYGRANVSIYWNYGSSQFTAGYNTVQTSGFFPYRTVTFGIENGKIAIAFSNPSANLRDIHVDLQSTNYSNATATDHLGKYSLAEDTNISDWTNTSVLTSIANLASVSPNGLMIGTNTTSLTSGYVLDVSGAAHVSGTIYGDGTISGAVLQDRSDPAEIDSLSDVNKWKVTGEEIDHNSLGDCAVDITEVKTGLEIKDKAGNIYNTLEEKVVPVKGSKETDIQSLSEAVTKLKEGISEISADFEIKEVSKTVETKGRNISKTVSTLSRAIQQLSERLDSLESSISKSESGTLLPK